MKWAKIILRSVRAGITAIITGIITSALV